MITFFDTKVDTNEGFPDSRDAINAINQIIVAFYIEKTNSYQVIVYTTQNSIVVPEDNIFSEIGFLYTVQRVKMSTEEELLKEMYAYLNVLKYTLIGYNIYNFDINYLQFRSEKLGLDLNWKVFELIDVFKKVQELNLTSSTLPHASKSLLNIDLQSDIFAKLNPITLPILTTIKLWEYFNKDSKPNVIENLESGYHLAKIDKGTLGEFSKIKEEFLEAEDSINQDNPLMCLMELSDLVGAIEAFANKHNLTLEELITMKNATKRAFESGRRS